MLTRHRVSFACAIRLEENCTVRQAPIAISSDIVLQSGKGTVRRKVKKVHKSSGTDEKKLQGALKKLNVQPIHAIEEVNMFKSDGNVIHFSAPKGTLVQVDDFGVLLLRTQWFWDVES
jgi:NAC domain